MIYPPKHSFRPKITHALEFFGWLGSGVKDKNGIEIYEGDIVEIGGSDTLRVIFDDAAFWLGDNEFFLYHFEPSELKVVGHIVEEE